MLSTTRWTTFLLPGGRKSSARRWSSDESWQSDLESFTVKGPQQAQFNKGWTYTNIRNRLGLVTANMMIYIKANYAAKGLTKDELVALTIE